MMQLNTFQLSKKINISPSTLCVWLKHYRFNKFYENNKYNITVEFLDELLNYLDLKANNKTSRVEEKRISINKLKNEIAPYTV